MSQKGDRGDGKNLKVGLLFPLCVGREGVNHGVKEERELGWRSPGAERGGLKVTFFHSS